jgi:hypothetical protein
MLGMSGMGVLAAPLRVLACSLGVERLGLHLEIRHAIENSNRFEPEATEMLSRAALHP